MDGSVVIGGVWSKMRWRRCRVRGASWDSLEYCVVDMDCFLEAGPIVCYCCRWWPIVLAGSCKTEGRRGFFFGRARNTTNPLAPLKQNSPLRPKVYHSLFFIHNLHLLSRPHQSSPTCGHRHTHLIIHHCLDIQATQQIKGAPSNASLISSINSSRQPRRASDQAAHKQRTLRASRSTTADKKRLARDQKTILTSFSF